MPRIVMAAFIAAVALFGTGLASSVTGGAGPVVLSPVMQSVPVQPAPVVDNTQPTTIRWEKFYDRSGNLLPGEPQDNVGPDSLYFKRFNVLTTFYGSPKSEVPDPSPENCRPAFTWQNAQTVTCMEPTGAYAYEVYNTKLRRHNTTTGAYTDVTIASGAQNCATDGAYLYVLVGNTVRKYTTAGVLVNTTTLNLTPPWYNFSVANDTVWCGVTAESTLYGFACAKFTGGSLTPDATWNIGGGGSSSPAQVAWDGEFYYVAWCGYDSNPFKRFNANRTLSASGTISSDPRGVMCSVHGARRVTQDSLYWKLFASTIAMYSSPKAQNVTPGEVSGFAWQNSQTLSSMTPDGHYVFEVYGTNLRRTDLTTDEAQNYTLADASGGACATDGEFVYVPDSFTMRKYTLDGTLVSTTTTDYMAWIGASTFGFGVANDTVWLTPSSAGTTWYGYACSKFTGGSITHDATWTTPGGTSSAVTLAYDGQFYYMTWGGTSSNTLLRFYSDRSIYSTGTISGGSPRGLMCRQGDYAVAVCCGVPYPAEVASFARMLVDSSGGRFAAADTYNIGNGAHATFPATQWYNRGYRAIVAFTDFVPVDSAALGDSLARFIELGGGVVEGTFADFAGAAITGDWRSTYAPFTLQSYLTSEGTMGTVHQPDHPVMAGVSALYVSSWRSGNTHNTLRSPNCVCLSEFTDANRCLAASFDSAGHRAVSIGMDPLDYWIASATGQWCRLFVNALAWTAVGPSLDVTAPNGGESWFAGTAHDITWDQTATGVRDSLYYSTDAGSSWIGVAYIDPAPSPLQYAWTVPPTPTTEARVKVVAWDADGGRVEDASDADFAIVAIHDAGVLAIIQPEDTVDSGAAIVPSAAVKNFGNVPETFPVRFHIGGFYTEDTSVTLDAGVTDTVAFPQWAAGPVGTFVVRCSTRLAGDTISANDRALSVVTVQPAGGVAETSILPLAFALHPARPNPTLAGAQIRYDLPHAASVRLSIYDATGSLVRRLLDEAQAPGFRRAYWNGRDDRGRSVAPGVYYCRFQTEDFRAAQKLVVRR